MAKKHFPLPKRFNVALSEQAYANLRQLALQCGLGNNYTLTVLLEHMDELIALPALLEQAAKLRAEYEE